MIKFTFKKFPFIKIIPKIVDYESIIVNEKQLSDEEKKQLKEAKEILSLHQIPLNKVRFVFDVKFTYDVTNNIVNPRYVKLVPKKKTKYDQSIAIDAPTDLMTILVGTYQTDYDDFKNVREIIRKSFVLKNLVLEQLYLSDYSIKVAMFKSILIILNQ